MKRIFIKTLSEVLFDLRYFLVAGFLLGFVTALFSSVNKRDIRSIVHLTAKIDDGEVGVQNLNIEAQIKTALRDRNNALKFYDDMVSYLKSVNNNDAVPFGREEFVRNATNPLVQKFMTIKKNKRSDVLHILELNLPTRDLNVDQVNAFIFATNSLVGALNEQLLQHIQQAYKSITDELYNIFADQQLQSDLMHSYAQRWLKILDKLASVYYSLFRKNLVIEETGEKSELHQMRIIFDKIFVFLHGKLIRSSANQDYFLRLISRLTVLRAEFYVLNDALEKMTDLKIDFLMDAKENPRLPDIQFISIASRPIAFIPSRIERKRYAYQYISNLEAQILQFIPSFNFLPPQEWEELEQLQLLNQPTYTHLKNSLGVALLGLILFAIFGIVGKVLVFFTSNLLRR